MVKGTVFIADKRDMRWKKFRRGEEVGRAGRLGLTLKCANRDMILREPGCQHGLWCANRYHRYLVSLLLELRELVQFGRCATSFTSS